MDGTRKAKYIIVVALALRELHTHAPAFEWESHVACLTPVSSNHGPHGSTVCL
jgi:hypothetical protein